MKKTVGYMLLLFLCASLVLNPERAVHYAYEGTELCAEVIIPSLFPFFVCSGLLVYSGFCEVIAKLFSPVMRPLFNINPSGAAAFILGLISGYPQGAVTAGQLYEGMYLSKSEAERLLAFCNNSGPLFILGTVGVSIYHSPKAGIILYCAHVLGAISVGIVFRFYKTKTYNAPKSELNTEKKNVSIIFSRAISDSIRNILNVCATVLFCSVISKIVMDILPFGEMSEALTASMLEFVSGLGRISYLDIEMTQKLILSAAVCAFAGISVHLQVMGVISKSGLSLKPYIGGKLLHMLFATGYTFLLLKIFPVAQSVFAVPDAPQRMSMGFFIGSACVMLSALIVTAVFLGYICTTLRKWKFKTN